MSGDLTRDELFKLMREEALATNDRDVMFHALVLSEECADDDFYTWAEKLLDAVYTLHTYISKDINDTRGPIEKDNLSLASYSAACLVHRLESTLTFARQLASMLERDAKKGGAK